MFNNNKRPVVSPTEVADVPRSRAKPGQVSILGPTIVLQGELRGDEDLLVQGTVQGGIRLSEYTVTVGVDGRVRGDIFARSIVVEGDVEGDLYGAERITIRETGRVVGNVVSPTLSLEEGARFKGAIDMEPDRTNAVFHKAQPKTATVPEEKAEKVESA